MMQMVAGCEEGGIGGGDDGLPTKWEGPKYVWRPCAPHGLFPLTNARETPFHLDRFGDVPQQRHTFLEGAHFHLARHGMISSATMVTSKVVQNVDTQGK